MEQPFSAYKSNNNSDPELVSINQWYIRNLVSMLARVT